MHLLPPRSPSDLKACAVIARSWTSAAQSHIFNKLLIRDPPWNDLWPRLQEVLRVSPHLIRYIRRLRLLSDELSLEVFSTICDFPYINLRSVLSLPTLARVVLASYFITPAIFLQMWERCSPTIRHLVLSCHFHLSSPEAIVSVDYLRDWLMHDLCPSDFSRLKLLSFWYAHGAVLRSARFAAALRNLEVFDLVLWQSDDTLDLSTLPNLRLLRMRPMSDSVQIILATLSMIPATSCIRRILLHSMYLTRGRCEQLDSRLVSLPVQPLPTLDLDIGSIFIEHLTNSNLDQYFSRMASRELVRSSVSTCAHLSLIQ
ncbi:hypothetical protein FB451DRAFT_1454751 [Mycena latifolia]|nr:hypothetical protein FB451DRAFT_1454751 [Mycena latifolia]